MAKLPPVDYYRLTVNRIAVPDLGPLCVLLTKAGYLDFAPELVTEVKSFAQKTNHETKAADFLKTWIPDHPTFKAKEAVNAFAADGRTAGAAYSGLRDLVVEGVLKKLGEGNYARTDVKSIAGPKKKDKPSNYSKRYEVPHADFILRLAKRSHGRIARAKLKEAFAKDGRNDTSVGTAIKSLLDTKQIRRVGEGEYELVTKPEKKKPPPAKAANGSAVMTETNHGS